MLTSLGSLGRAVRENDEQFSLQVFTKTESAGSGARYTRPENQMWIPESEGIHGGA